MEFKSQYEDVSQQLLQIIQQNFQAVGATPIIRIHGDFHVGNILAREQGIHIVDLDDCLMGPAIQDLWMLLTGDKQQMQQQLQCLLDGYQEFHDFNHRERYLIESLRALRLMHYAAWLAKRWEDPAFPLNFPWFNTSDYWREHIQNLMHQQQLIEKINLTC